MELDADIYQVVIYEKFGTQPEDSSYSFAELLNITNKGNHSFEHFEGGQQRCHSPERSVHPIHKFEDFLQHYEKKGTAGW